MNILQRLLFRAKTGADIVDLGVVKEEVVIRYKDLFIHLLIGGEGEVKSISWSTEPLSSVPIREYWIAKHPPRQRHGL